MIQVNSISKIYSEKSLFFKKKSEVSVISDISFSITSPGIVGIFGANGSGKSTLIKLLSGITYPSKGDISIYGFNPFKKERSFLKKIALYVCKSNQIHDELTPDHHYLLQKEIYGINEEEYLSMLNDLVDGLKIEKLLHKQVGKLSFGQRAMMEIASIFISYPKVIFLDEPMVGIDEKNKRLLVGFIKKYQKRYGSMVIVTSNSYSEINNLTSKVIRLDKGKIINTSKLFQK